MVLTTIQNTDKNLIYTNTNFTVENDNIIYDETSNNESFNNLTTNDITTNDITVLNRSKEQSTFNNSYYATMRDALPVIKNQQTVINTISTWVNPISVAPTTLRTWVGMAYSETLKRFVAVSQNSVDAVYSNDGGNNWISTSISSLDYFKSVWQNNLFIAIGFVRSYSTSPDGITWTERTDFFPTTVDWRDVIWLPQYNRWLACTSNNTTNKIIQSPDITTNTWTATGINQPSQHGWHSFAYSPEMNMLVCVAVNTSNNVAYSTNGGLDWTQITVGTTELREVVWSRELNLFVVVGNNGASFWSENGINWTAGTGLSSLRYLRVLWIPELHIFIAPSDNLTPIVSGTEIGYSFDGKIWSNINILGNDFQIRAIAYSPQHANICMASRTETTPVANNRLRFFRIPLSNRWPTSDNVFNHAFNKIDDNGTWSFSRILINGGSQNSPGLSFQTPETGANSGIFNPGDGQISISTNDVERLRQSNDILTFFTKQQFNQTGINADTVLTNATTFPFMGVSTVSSNITITLPSDVGEFVGRNMTFFIGKNHTSNKVIINCPTGHFLNGVQNGTYEMNDMGCVQVFYEFYNPGSGITNRSLWGIRKVQLFGSNDRDLSIPTNGTIVNRLGSAGAPSYSFINAPNIGMYAPSTGEVGFSIAGNIVMKLDNSKIQTYSPISAPNGSRGAPSYSWSSDPDSGLYFSGTEMRVSMNNTDIVSYSTDRINNLVITSMPSIILTPSVNENLTVDVTLTRSDILNSHTFIYSATNAVRTITLPSDLNTSDVGLVLKFGRIAGTQNIVISAATNTFLNNTQNGTITLSTTRYVELIFYKLNSGTEYWIST